MANDRKMGADEMKHTNWRMGGVYRVEKEAGAAGGEPVM
jgi:hypothetical protein